MYNYRSLQELRRPYFLVIKLLSGQVTRAVSNWLNLTSCLSYLREGSPQALQSGADHPVLPDISIVIMHA